MKHIGKIIATATGGIGGPLLFLLSGIYLTLATGFVQFRRFPAALRTLLSGQDSREGLSPRRALFISLGAVMGPGNLIGVAAAVAYGGPGSVFWMWFSGMIGMALRFAETALAASYRSEDTEGMGGVMRKGLHAPHLSRFFAVAGTVTSLMMADLTSAGVLARSLETHYSFPPFFTVLLLSFLMFPVIRGGRGRIASVSPVLVAAVTALYLALSMWIFLSSPDEAILALRTILDDAFSFRAAAFGTLPLALRQGIAKGIYSNECGIGSEPSISSACPITSPLRQGQCSMLGPFLDTVVFCSLSGILCVMSGESAPERMLPSLFSRFYPHFGALFIEVILILLVYTTVISWYFPGESFARSGFGERCVPLYRAGYLLIPLLAPFLKTETLYLLCDASVSLMAFPSLSAILLLSPAVIRLSFKDAEGGSLRPR